MNYVALEFDDNRIRVATARAVAKRTRFLHGFVIDLDRDNDAQTGERLKKELSKRRIGRADALVIVKRSSVEIREINVPPAPDNELPDMVRFLARNEFGSLNDHWLLDFVPLSNDPSVPRKVLASGLSPERHQQILKIAEAAGLKVKHILLRPFESFSLLQPHLTPGKRCLVVDLGDNHMDMLVSVDRNIVATRTVRIVDPGSNDCDGRILAEVKRTAVSAESVLGNRPIDEVLLLGDSSHHETLATALREKMQLEVRVVRPFDLVEQDLSEIPRHESAQYSALLGSISQQAAGKRHAIDYLNPRRPIIKNEGKKRLKLYGALAAAVAMMILIAGYWILRSQATEIANLTKQLDQLTRTNAGNAQIPAVDQTLGEVKVIDDWKLAGVNWLDEICETSKLFLTSDDAIVDIFNASIRDRGTTVSIRGRVANNTMPKLIDSLTQRYLITPERWEAEDQDPSYPEPYDLKINLETNRDELLKVVDQQVNDHFKQRRDLRKKQNK